MGRDKRLVGNHWDLKRESNASGREQLVAYPGFRWRTGIQHVYSVVAGYGEECANKEKGFVVAPESKQTV